MRLRETWDRYQAGGPTAIPVDASANARLHLYRSVLRFAAGDLEGAVDDARRAATLAPASRLSAEAARYLERVRTAGRSGVYAAPDAFVAFIRGGGNVPLYAATSAALRDVYLTLDRVELLDLGVGNGLALLPALTPNIRAVRIVEPSTTLMAATATALSERTVQYEAFGVTAQAFASAHPEGVRADIAQMTFSLQSLSPPDRGRLLGWLRRSVPRLLVAEFDVPKFEHPLSPAAFGYAVERYETGLAEYAHEAGLVAQGFLLPVFFSYFDSATLRTNHEQPASAWADELNLAGFHNVKQRLLFDYWWAPAVLFDAQ